MSKGKTLMLFQVLATVVSTGNHSLTVGCYTPKALPLATARITYIFNPRDKASDWTSNPQFHVKAFILKMPEPLLFSPSIFSGNGCWICQVDFWECAQEVNHGSTWFMGRNSTSKHTCYWWVLNRSYVVPIWFFKIPQANSKKSPPR